MSGRATVTVFACNDSSLGILVDIEVSNVCGGTIVCRYPESEIEVTVIESPIPPYLNLMSTHEFVKGLRIEGFPEEPVILFT